MSDIVSNALRYNTFNTKRVDVKGKNTGQPTGLEYKGKPVIGFDCSGFFYHVMRESGYSVGHECAAEYLSSDRFSDVNIDDVKPGDMINFENHIGIVNEYDPKTGKGEFVHMSGGNPPNHGRLRTSPFTTGKDSKYKTYYGITRSIKAFRRVKEAFYRDDIDLHKKNSNPNPVFQPIPQNLKKHAELARQLALNPNYIAPESPKSGKKDHELRAIQAIDQESRPSSGLRVHGTILKRGDKGPAVKQLQEKLNSARALPGLPQSGNFGQHTEDAIRYFQRKHKLKVNGIADKGTLEALGMIRTSSPSWCERYLSKALNFIAGR